MAQGLTDEQLKIRRGKYMASDLAAYQGMSPYSSPIAAWALNLGHDTLETNDAMQAGIHLETGLIEWACEKLAAEIWDSPGTIFHIAYPWAGCTPDALLEYPGHDSVMIQIKCHGLHMAKDYGTPTEAGNEFDNDVIPEHYLIQVQWEMFVVSGTKRKVNTDFCYLGAYFGGADFRLFRIKRDQDMIDLMVEFGEKFWKKHLDPTGKQEAPPLDGSPGSAAFIKRRHPLNTKAEMIPPPDGAAEWAERYHSAHAHVGEWNKAKDEAKNHLTFMLEDHDGIEGICTYKAAAVKPKVNWEGVAEILYVVMETQAMQLENAIVAPLEEFAAPFTTTPEPSRRFLFKWKPSE